MQDSSALRSIGDIVKKIMGKILSVAPAFVRNGYKRLFEWLFWRKHIWQNGGKLGHVHLHRTFTTTFGLETAFYDGKDILDIGCGPCGSLEWADNAASRTGLDPLANNYLKMANVSEHKMKYVQGRAEDLPFESQSYDVVSLLNSLDHVEDVDQSTKEAVRVCRSGGTILVVVEINHEPTITEPHFVTETILDTFPGCQIETQKVVAIRADHNVYGSLLENKPPSDASEPAILVAKLTKQ